MKKFSILSKKNAIIFTLCLLSVISIIIFFLYYKFIHKENNIILLQKKDSAQEIYLLGTIHEYHFYNAFHYSIADILNVIHTIDPDILLLEYEQEAMDKYNVIKSPIEMIPIWCYAQEKGIPTKGVDWFKVTEDSRSWTTNRNRDDHIFENIIANIDEEQKKVLIILGSRHRMEQSQRFRNKGYSQINLSDVSSFFTGDRGNNFNYPYNTAAEIEKQIEYWETISMNEAIHMTTETSAGRNYWLAHYDKLSKQIQRILNDIIIERKLYW